MYENAGVQTVGLSDIGAGAGESQPLRVTAASDTPTLIPDPVVTYIPGASTGSLMFQPVAGQSGVATISVTVEGGGPDMALSTVADNATTIRTFRVTVMSLLAGNVDGDADFDANDTFLIQLVQLAATDFQIDQSKGSSNLTAAQIRAHIGRLATSADVDGDADFDANDSFLIHIVQLSGTDTQIDQSKGSSPLSAEQIRNNVSSLAAGPADLPRWGLPLEQEQGRWVPVEDDAHMLSVETYPPVVVRTLSIRGDFRHWIDTL